MAAGEAVSAIFANQLEANRALLDDPFLFGDLTNRTLHIGRVLYGGFSLTSNRVVTRIRIPLTRRGRKSAHLSKKGGVAQLVRARGSYPRRPGFESLHRHPQLSPAMIAERVRNFISKHKLLRKGQRVLVTLSGGPDSAALLTLMSELGFRTSALYVNHNLRGQESLQEERFVRKFCGDRRIPLFVETIHWRKRPANLEEEARKRRYRHILKVAAEHKFSRVALAHHADDVAETLLLQLIRGSGPLGLQGLRPQRGIFVRPMLETSRQQILEYLNQSNTPYFTDTSNQDPSFRRNRVRLELIPYLEKHFHPRVKAALARAASLIHEQNKLVDQLLETFRTAPGVPRKRDPDPRKANGSASRSVEKGSVEESSQTAGYAASSFGKKHGSPSAGDSKPQEHGTSRISHGTIDEGLDSPSCERGDSGEF